MFEIEYRTVSRKGMRYPSRIALVGSHKALYCEQAKVYFLSRTPSVEVVSVRFVGVC